MKRTGIFAASLMCSVMLSAQTREAAVLFSGTDLDESYLLAEKVSVTFDEDGKALISLDGKDGKEFVLDGTYTVTAEFKDAFKLTANQDPNHTSNYYSTFFTQKGAYKVPTSEAKAYIGEVSGDVLNLTDVGSIIHGGEPVILKATGSSITLMPSCNKVAASTENKLLGTEEGISNAGSNVYALSYGDNGVGFYLWNGKAIGKNKAYLDLGTSSVKALTFEFEEATSIHNSQFIIHNSENDAMYNLNGVRVDDSYKGIVIKNGKKVLKK